MTVVVILADDGAVWDVEVSPADPDPERHALVMLRMMLVQRGPLPELRVVGRRA